MGDPAVRYLAVGKVSTRIVAASYEHRVVPGVDCHAVARKLMASDRIIKLTPPADFHLSVSKGGGLTVHVHVDTADHCFIAVTPATTPRRIIFSASGPCLMTELAEGAVDLRSELAACTVEDGATKPARELLRRVATKYSAEDVDKLMALQRSVDQVQVQVAGALGKAIQRGERVETLEGKTEQLQVSSDMFVGRTTRVRRIMQYRYYKLVCVCATLVLVVILYVTLPFIADSL